MANIKSESTSAEHGLIGVFCHILDNVKVSAFVKMDLDNSGAIDDRELGETFIAKSGC